MGSSYSTCVKHVAAAINYASVVDKDIDDCLFLSHDNKHSPK
jgi:hypothetical protein